MSDDNQSQPQSPNQPLPSPNGDAQESAEKAKRERTSYPVRLLRRRDDGLFEAPDGPSFATIDAAERYILSECQPGATYMIARVVGARRRPKPSLEDVSL